MAINSTELLNQSSETALIAVRSFAAKSLTNVQKSTDPIGGRLKAVILDRNRLEQSGVVKQPGTSQESIDYIVNILKIDYDGTLDGIKKGELFDSVEIVRLNDTTKPDIDGYDYLLRVYPLDAGTGIC